MGLAFKAICDDPDQFQALVNRALSDGQDEAPGMQLVLLEQVRTIDRRRLGDYIGRLDETAMEAVDAALAISIGIKEKEETEVRR